MGSEIRNFKDLIVWQKAVRLVTEVYRLTRSFPREEMFVLTAQVRRAAVSIPSNIAEGHARQGREYAHYLSISIGSAAEVETQLLIAAELGYLPAGSIAPVEALLTEVRRMAATIINRLSS